MESRKQNKVTSKQERFAREYVVDLSGTQAAVRAGYSKRTANEQGSRLLANVSVKARIAELQAEVAERLDFTVDSIMADLERLCREAAKAKQFGPAVRAKELQGRRLGMFVDRHLIDEVSQIPDEKLAGQIAKQYGGGDRALERRLFRNVLQSMPPNSFEPRSGTSDHQIDRLLGGVDTLH